MTIMQSASGKAQNRMSGMIGKWYDHCQLRTSDAGQDDIAGRALKKMVKPSRRGPMVERLVESYLVSERRACRVLCLPRATHRYRSCLDPRIELRMRTRAIAQARVRYGYRKVRLLLNREGWDVGKYLVYRLYTEEGLSLKRMKPAGKRKAARQREERFKPTAPDEAWCMDFVVDQLQDGARFRSLTVVDVYMREAIGIEVGQSLKPDDVARTLNYIKLGRGVPKAMFCDNRSEFTSQAKKFLGALQ